MAGAFIDTPLSLIPTPHKRTGKTDDFTMDASHMALVHNVIILGYNSIYQQAPLIKASDVRDFLGYSLAWSDMVVNHHHAEEEVYFPLLEEAVGVSDLMNGCKEEHEAFYAGLDQFAKYAKECLEATDAAKAFDATRLIKIMDTFGPALQEHLSNEIPTLESLSRYNLPEQRIKEIKEKVEKDAMGRASPVYSLPMLWCNLDSEYENGMWTDFPPIPWPVKWTMVNVFGWWRSNWWRFGSVDRFGKRRQLLALREGY